MGSGDDRPTQGLVRMRRAWLIAFLLSAGPAAGQTAVSCDPAGPAPHETLSVEIDVTVAPGAYVTTCAAEVPEPPPPPPPGDFLARATAAWDWSGSVGPCVASVCGPGEFYFLTTNANASTMDLGGRVVPAISVEGQDPALEGKFHDNSTCGLGCGPMGGVAPGRPLDDGGPITIAGFTEIENDVPHARFADFQGTPGFGTAGVLIYHTGLNPLRHLQVVVSGLGVVRTSVDNAVPPAPTQPFCWATTWGGPGSLFRIFADFDLGDSAPADELQYDPAWDMAVIGRGSGFKHGRARIGGRLIGKMGPVIVLPEALDLTEIRSFCAQGGW